MKRNLTSISVLPLRDEINADPDSAIAILVAYQESAVSIRFVRYEINARYNNGDEIRGQFQSKSDAVEFLRKLK